MEYEKARSYIDESHRFGGEVSLKAITGFLARLGNPQDDLQFIHIAGTNGKGSVGAYLASILQEAGYKIGRFVSPTLYAYRERIQINGNYITREDFGRLMDSIAGAIEEIKKNQEPLPSPFEIETALSFLYFREQKCDFVLLECGMGGLNDATNVIKNTQLAVITSISMDHMEYLGDTIGQIASEKAGIIKEGVPVIYDGRVPEVEQVVLAQAERMHAPAYPYYSSMTEILDKTDKSIDFVLNYSYDDKEKTAGRTGSMQITVPYLAEYQLVNSSLAAITAHVIDPEGRLTDEAIAAGIAETRWQGRMETVLPGVVLDGAHNADGIREFIRTVQSVEKRREVSLLFSAVADKEYDTMIRTICEAAHFSHVTVTQIDGSRIVPAQQLAEVFRKYTSAPVEACPDIRQAFETALAVRGEGMLFCAGSLYLVGELKAILRNETRQ